MLKDEQVTPLLDAIGTLKAYDLTSLPKVVQMALGSIVEQAEAVDKTLGQTLSVVVHKHDCGINLFTVIVPEGASMTPEDAYASMVTRTTDTCEVLNIRPFQDNMVDDYMTAEQRALGTSKSDEDELDFYSDPSFASSDNGPN